MNHRLHRNQSTRWRIPLRWSADKKLIVLLANWLVLIAIGLAGCAAYQSNAGVPLPSLATQSPTAEPTLDYVIQVKSWVSNPTPEHDDRVIVFASLIKNRRFLGGIMMKATWIDPAHGDVQRECYLLVNYQRGNCIIDVKDFPVGKFVPVNITFKYKDHLYTTTTGFTPK